MEYLPKKSAEYKNKPFSTQDEKKTTFVENEKN